MRKSDIFFVVALARALPVATAFADAPSLPQRKAGFWELKTSMDEGIGPKESTLKVCIGADMEANTVRASMVEHKNNCSSYDIKQSDGKTIVDADCMFNGRHVQSRTEMSGDFAASFKVKIDSTTSDTRDSTKQTVTVKRTIVQDGKFLSDSCGEVKAGFAVAPDGSTIAVQ